MKTVMILITAISLVIAWHGFKAAATYSHEVRVINSAWDEYDDCMDKYAQFSSSRDFQMDNCWEIKAYGQTR